MCIRDRVKIGNNVIIGMGVLVTSDIQNGMIVYSNPARVIRQKLTHKLFDIIQQIDSSSGKR